MFYFYNVFYSLFIDFILLIIADCPENLFFANVDPPVFEMCYINKTCLAFISVSVVRYGYIFLTGKDTFSEEILHVVAAEILK